MVFSQIVKFTYSFYLFSASLDITRLGPLEPCLELESSCRLEETVLSVPPQLPVSAGLFTVGPEGT